MLMGYVLMVSGRQHAAAPWDQLCLIVVVEHGTTALLLPLTFRPTRCPSCRRSSSLVGSKGCHLLYRLPRA